MSCAGCLRWSRRPVYGTRYGFCRWPGLKPAPYWYVERPEAVLMTADIHGEDCAAFREKRR